MENKFKVGDLVKGNSDKYTCTTTKMTKGIIERVEKGFVYIKVLIHEDNRIIGYSYWADEKDFEYCDQPDSIKIFRSSKATICEVRSEGKRLSKGVAKCCPEDEYSFIEGSKIALDRAESNLTL